ncbi:MAG: alpha/beta hydrolase [Sphingomonas sp.]|uniref:alpha/beta fold hydrolase n=1 Tax=Sphingomonas sp. TaxID=28214 RepID=UPI00121DECC7|nr:alpha/beta hydrolase [Sphingomonas sp.]THD34776.1 MAG: alpha/beta hydrolase [Sphingomonas sp.]
MSEFDLQRVALSTGVELDVAVAGDPANPAIVLLHGFPESHRTWRFQIPELAKDHFVLAPDQRGFARSSKPEGVENYTPDKPVADLLALADHFGIGDFTLVGHDWGGAIAWMAALQNQDRIKHLIIVNAPHPFVFQRLLFDDMEQRAASQYITAFRNPAIDAHIDSIGLSEFFDGSFMRHTDFEKVRDEKATYLDQWSQPGAMPAMLNWYRASALVVPGMDDTPERPAYLDGPFPPLNTPTLVIWGTGDKALLPSNLDGLDQYVPNMTLKRVDAGHFVPWENPEAVTSAMREWLAAQGA